MNSSIGLSMVDDYTFLMQQDMLKVLQKTIGNIERNFHIYMIVRGQRVTYDPDSIKITRNWISGRVRIQNEDKFIYQPFQIKNYLKTTNLKLNKDYPYEVLDIRTNDDKIVLKSKARLFLHEIGGYSDLQVVYVGQAKGKNLNRTALDRLQDHSMLQKIYYETPPDKDVWITLWRFTRNELMLIPPSYENEIYDRTMNYFNLINDPYEKISKDQEINFTEAALIRYFHPIYNSEFKYTFPSRDHVVYSDCYKSKLDYVAVELDTERFKFSLYSDNVKPRFQHTIIFPLSSEKNIKELFNLNNIFKKNNTKRS